MVTRNPAPHTPAIHRDGWTLERQAHFLLILFHTGSTTRTCAAVDMSCASV